MSENKLKELCVVSNLFLQIQMFALAWCRQIHGFVAPLEVSGLHSCEAEVVLTYGF